LEVDGDIEEEIGDIGAVIGCICLKRKGKHSEQNGNIGAGPYKIVKNSMVAKKTVRIF
jgi:NAD+--asparagine ADP-ribosyltransferase